MAQQFKYVYSLVLHISDCLFPLIFDYIVYRASGGSSNLQLEELDHVISLDLLTFLGKFFNKVLFRHLFANAFIQLDGT